jgi:hypothetical protein
MSYYTTKIHYYFHLFNSGSVYRILEVHFLFILAAPIFILCKIGRAFRTYVFLYAPLLAFRISMLFILRLLSVIAIHLLYKYTVIIYT